MAKMFNTLLRDAGIPLADIRLLRHKGGKTRNGKTPFEMWRDKKRDFEDYQSYHGRHNLKKLSAPFWAVFVGTPGGETLFVGIYKLDDVQKSRSRCDYYKLRPMQALGKLKAKLLVDWAVGKRKNSATRAWVQYADRRDKPFAELRKEFADGNSCWKVSP